MSGDGILRIVVGVDLDAPNERALDEAIRYAWRLDRDELHPVFVIGERPRRALAAISADLESARQRLRDHVVARCEAVGIRWDQSIVFHVRIGDPVEAIHQVAVDVDADLIIVGTHARGRLTKALLGSIAEELVRTARVPVMVARPKELGALPKSDRPEDATPGADLHAPRVMSNEHLSFGRRDSHISGLV